MSPFPPHAEIDSFMSLRGLTLLFGVLGAVFLRVALGSSAGHYRSEIPRVQSYASRSMADGRLQDEREKCDARERLTLRHGAKGRDL